MCFILKRFAGLERFGVCIRDCIAVSHGFSVVLPVTAPRPASTSFDVASQDSARSALSLTSSTIAFTAFAAAPSTRSASACSAVGHQTSADALSAARCALSTSLRLASIACSLAATTRSRAVSDRFGAVRETGTQIVGSFGQGTGAVSQGLRHGVSGRRFSRRVRERPVGVVPIRRPKRLIVAPPFCALTICVPHRLINIASCGIAAHTPMCVATTKRSIVKTPASVRAKTVTPLAEDHPRQPDPGKRNRQRVLLY